MNNRGQPPKPAVQEQVERARAWLETFATPTKTIRSLHTSYWYKHAAEEWAGDYVSNESFIEAARQLGYRCSFYNSSNCRLNLSLPRGYGRENRFKSRSRRYSSSR